MTENIVAVWFLVGLIHTFYFVLSGDGKVPFGWVCWLVALGPVGVVGLVALRIAEWGKWI